MSDTRQPSRPPRPSGNGEPPPFDTAIEFDLSQVQARLKSLEQRSENIEKNMLQIKDLLFDIKGHLAHMPTATDLGAMKGRLDEMPTAQEFGEIRGRVAQLPTTWSLVVILLTVAIAIIAATGLLQYGFLSFGA